MPEKRVPYKKLLHIGGNILAIAGVVFVIFRIKAQLFESEVGPVEPVVFLTIIVLAGMYAVTNLFLVSGWRYLLKQYDVDISFATAVKLYGVSQVAKYVPGNVSHLLSRQALGVAQGISGWKLAKTTFLELVIIACSGLCFSIVLAPLFVDWLSYQVSLALFLIFEVLCFFLLRRLVSKFLAYTYMLQSLFLLCSGVLFTLLLYVVCLASGALHPGHNGPCG